jgi:hypothetical protein
MTDLIEQKIIDAVKNLLCEKVNELINAMQHNIPLVEFSDYQGMGVIVPVLTLADCEQSEKERIIKLDTYSLHIVFSFPETPESQYNCYAYSAAVGKALKEDVTLGGIVDRAVIAGKKYVPPKKAGSGQGWELSITLRITVEGF